MKKDLLISIIFSILLLPFVDSFVSKQPKIKIKQKVKEKINIKYGIEVDKFIINELKVKRNSNLSTILGNLKVSNINKTINKAAKVFDLKKIKLGNKYKVFYSKDSLKDIKYLVYQQSAIDYILFDFTDSVLVEKKQRKVTINSKTISGIITSSLWNSINNADGNPLLSLELSDMYAWTIDFFGLQKDDKFKVIYEENFIDKKSVGLNKIKAAWFKHNGVEYYAIPFYQDSTLSFFGIDGVSLKKAFLKAPLNYRRISSGFSNSRLHPILKIRRPHHGVDYAAPSGTPVVALGDGKIIKANYSGGAGNYVKIKHNSVYTTGYMHLLKYGKGITVGKQVKQGDIIGYVGSTGLSTGAHLDFRVWKNGANINPLNIDAPAAEPIKKENIENFNKVKNEWLKKLKI